MIPGSGSGDTIMSSKRSAKKIPFPLTEIPFSETLYELFLSFFFFFFPQRC
uniref:Uncharacterized protein n=1 Tax=Rhizophora mucronata TaxID=61149 RepID=A0A2P2P0D6_RHIMU